MEPSRFDDVAFFRRLAQRARALLIGRRALVLLGLPVLTADYHFWIAIDDLIATKQVAARPKDLEDISLLRLVRWFTSRYPTAEQRLAYVRQAYARWAALRRERVPDGDSPD